MPGCRGEGGSRAKQSNEKNQRSSHDKKGVRVWIKVFKILLGLGPEQRKMGGSYKAFQCLRLSESASVQGAGHESANVPRHWHHQAGQRPAPASGSDCLKGGGLPEL